MLLGLTVKDKSGAVAAWAQFVLDFGTKKWSVQEQTHWGRTAFSNGGTFELRPNGVMWLCDHNTPQYDNTLILWNPPTSASDPAHLKGEGRISKSLAPSFDDARLGWAVPGLSPVRQEVLNVCEKLLASTPPPLDPPNKVTPHKPEKNEGSNVSGCGDFPGWVIGQIQGRSFAPEVVTFKPYQMEDPKDPTKTITKTGGTGRVTSPTTAWEELAQGVERQRNAIGSLWTLFDGGSKRPLPGDVYLLKVVHANAKKKTKPGYFAHVGIVIDASGDVWKTADGGQGVEGFSVSYVYRRFQANINRIKGEFGEETALKGWVNLHNLLPGWKPQSK